MLGWMLCNVHRWGGLVGHQRRSVRWDWGAHLGRSSSIRDAIVALIESLEHVLGGVVGTIVHVVHGGNGWRKGASCHAASLGHRDAALARSICDGLEAVNRLKMKQGHVSDIHLPYLGKLSVGRTNVGDP